MSASHQELKVMSFGEHLEELRSRILRSLGITLLLAIVALIFQGPLMDWIAGPHVRAMGQVRGRRLASEVEDRLALLRSDLAAVPLPQGRAVLAAGESGESRWAALRARAREPGSDPLLRDLVELLSDEESARDRNDLTSRVARLRGSLEEARGDHPWGAAGSLDAAESHREGIATILAGWRTPSDDGSPAAAVVDPEIERRVAGAVEVVAEVEEELEDLVRWRELRTPLQVIHYTESFFSHLKLAFLIGLVVALPWVTGEIWGFVAAGLYVHERSAVRPFIPLSFLGLALGGLFAYEVLIPVGLTYLGGYGDPDLFSAGFRLSDYLSLVFTLLIGMGLVFQLPLLMVFLSRAGIVGPRQFRQYQRYAILGALVLGAFLTPPDVVTQLLMAGPLVLLYESGIWASVWFGRRRKEAESG